MLKILVDAYKDQQQLFITGSSSFRILDMTEEPLTGRKIVHYLYPLSLEEVSATIGLHMLDTHMEAILRYGLYPAVQNAKSEKTKQAVLLELATEIKWNKSKKDAPEGFRALYRTYTWHSLQRDNWYEAFPKSSEYPSS